METISQVLATALSTLESMGILTYLKAMIIIALVGGFISVIFNRK